MAGAAGAADAPTWKLSGNVNFQVYNIDQDWILTKVTSDGDLLYDTTGTDLQDHGWYFGVDESELQLNVSGTADNGLNYGFKIEMNANTTDGSVADEVRLQLSGGWGTLQMGDEDGAEDIMNYGGESLMGATGGFDGDYDDVLIRAGNWAIGSSTLKGTSTWTSAAFAAPSYPTIAGDTSDHTKVSYFSPRFSGFQVGASITPTSSMDGDEFKADSDFENHIGLGANYDNSFGDLRIRASAVYSMASHTGTGVEDIAAYSVGGIVGFGPFSVGANWTDNGESGQWTGTGVETSYWNVAASFETGPIYLSAGYMASTLDSGNWGFGESTFDVIALTADYTVAPGLGVYAEVDMISDEILDAHPDVAANWSNDTTLFIVGANVSF
jgi:hypothetical protein